MSKKYFWLKLKNDFFNQREIKKLRKIAGGDTFTIIYLKMQLLSIQTEGILKFEGTEETLADQLALELDEDEDNIKLTLSFLHSNGLIEQISDSEFIMPKTVENLGSESGSAERMRRLRNKKPSHCDSYVTSGDEKVTTEIELELEKELERELELDRDIETEGEKEEKVCCNKLQPIIDSWNNLNLQKLVSIKPGTNRYTLLNSRIKEYGMESVLQAIDEISTSDFLKGQNKKGWTITFDWFIKPNNFIKVLEGNYKNNTNDPEKEKRMTGTSFMDIGF